MNNVIEMKAAMQNRRNRVYEYIESADADDLGQVISAIADRLYDISDEKMADAIEAMDAAGKALKDCIERADRHPRFCKCIECETAAADAKYNILMDNKDRA